jgi:tRNA acetyltransferase TAN1
MKFNFIATTFRFKEEDLKNELYEMFTEFGDRDVSLALANMPGIILGLSTKNNIDFIGFLRENLKNNPWDIRYLLRFIPIDKVVLTDVDIITKSSAELLEGVSKSETMKILIEKRHTNIKSVSLINSIAPFLQSKINLTNPDKILLVEILGKYTGLSVIKSSDLFSSMIEKRNTL